MKCMQWPARLNCRGILDDKRSTKILKKPPIGKCLLKEIPPLPLQETVIVGTSVQSLLGPFGPIRGIDETDHVQQGSNRETNPPVALVPYLTRKSRTPKTPNLNSARTPAKRRAEKLNMLIA
ncbi:predicted protein [Histoplasma capsulatum G186AR]|uniref:Uncharacterized protein n=1 Tax=Ajellomyces capsulatus (strain G186AR / H82 / ATCC MYA-2454 / RMSCC 2432) TaxID=447093 RepID=C0NLY1_AJECG|nr:uncharacterized protein HCBG_04511 [Histoplasma capsulatum G186AR]EEH07632.1 predicted protein [Histoplasma capsulatum G186AR]